VGVRVRGTRRWGGETARCLAISADAQLSRDWLAIAVPIAIAVPVAIADGADR
jgi:hypothetical protein